MSLERDVRKYSEFGMVIEVWRQYRQTSCRHTLGGQRESWNYVIKRTSHSQPSQGLRQAAHSKDNRLLDNFVEPGERSCGGLKFVHPRMKTTRLPLIERRRACRMDYLRSRAPMTLSHDESKVNADLSVNQDD